MGPFLIRNVLKFSGQDWGKTKAKLEVSWLPSSCMNTVWGKSVFLTHGAMSSTECRRAEEGLPTHAGRSDAPRPRPRTTDHCSRVLGPAVTVTCRNHSGAGTYSRHLAGWDICVGSNSHLSTSDKTCCFQYNRKDFCSSRWSHLSFSVPGSADFSETSSRDQRAILGRTHTLLPKGTRYSHRPCSRGLTTQPSEAQGHGDQLWEEPGWPMPPSENALEAARGVNIKPPTCVSGGGVPGE